MRNKILLIILTISIAAYVYQDKMFQAPEKPIISSPVVKVKAPKKIVPKLLTLDVVHIKTGHKNLSPPVNLEELSEKLNHRLSKRNIALKINYHLVDDMKEFFTESNDHQLVITRTLKVVQLIENGADIQPLFYVSPFENSCFREIQIVTLKDSAISSLADISGKRISLPDLKNVFSLPFRKVIQEKNLVFSEINNTDSPFTSLENLKNGAVEAVGLFEGFLKPDHPEYSLYKTLHSSTDQIHCYTLFASKKIDAATLNDFVSETKLISGEPEENSLLKDTLKMQKYEEVTDVSWNALLEMSKKFKELATPNQEIL